MNCQKQNFILCLITLLAFSLACNRFMSSSSENQNTSNSNSGSLGQGSGEKDAQKRDPNEKVFKGAIYTNKGPSELVMKLRREGDQITGSYYYTKVRKDISLRGSVDKGHKFKIEETSEGKVTGVFTGEWKDSSNDPLIALEGEWRKPGGQNFGFAAYEQINESTGGQIETKTRIEEDKKKKVSINAYYPQLANFGSNTDKINRDVYNEVDAQVLSFRATMKELGDLPPEVETSYSLDINYNTIIATDDLISFDFIVSTYTGGAHPNHYEMTLTYSLKDGNKFTLSDLFKPQSSYLKKISDYCIAELKKPKGDPDNQIEPDPEWIERGAAPNEDNYGNWNISKKGLVITFDPYQVAPYAAGPQVVVVPYGVLKDVVKENGPLAPFAKREKQ
jgi:hypothetical protein